MAKKKSDEKGSKTGQKPAVDKAAVKQETKKQPAPANTGKKKPEPPAVEVKPVKEAAKEMQKSAAKTKKKAAAHPSMQSPAMLVSTAPEPAAQASAVNGFLTVRLPKKLRTSLEQKMIEEEVSLDELVTYLLMRGLSVK